MMQTTASKSKKETLHKHTNNANCVSIGYKNLELSQRKTRFYAYCSNLSFFCSIVKIIIANSKFWKKRMKDVRFTFFSNFPLDFLLSFVPLRFYVFVGPQTLFLWTSYKPQMFLRSLSLSLGVIFNSTIDPIRWHESNELTFNIHQRNVDLLQ